MRPFLILFAVMLAVMSLFTGLARLTQDFWRLWSDR